MVSKEVAKEISVTLLCYVWNACVFDAGMMVGGMRLDTGGCMGVGFAFAWINVYLDLVIRLQHVRFNMLLFNVLFAWCMIVCVVVKVLL